MQDLPQPDLLVALVADFLRTEILPNTRGAQGFQLRVAVNALDLSVRQMRGAWQTNAQEYERLNSLLAREGSLDELNRALCDEIASGSMTLETPGLADHLWATTLAKLAIDQPNYAAYRREMERVEHPQPSS